MTGRLQLIPTPIGNLGDLSERAVAALRDADAIACEDTRYTGRLLAHLGIRSQLVSVHEHNERRRIPQLLERLHNGETVALVSDAGTPLVSDPGFALTRAVIEAGLAVEALPGPSAALTALLVSGLEPQPFTFVGFPPPKSGKRQRFFRSFAALGHTLVAFESPHRITASLADAREAFGSTRRAAIARELTKVHEEVLRGTLGDLAEELESRERQRGEFVLLVARADGD